MSLCGLDCGVQNSVKKPISDHLGASTLVIGCYMVGSGPERLSVHLWHSIRERGLWMFGGRGCPTARTAARQVGALVRSALRETSRSELRPTDRSSAADPLPPLTPS